jgi:putative tryptophan/tyrosine transport system substrate-binding protein
LIDPKFPPANLGASELRSAASTIGQSLTFLNASTDAELDATFEALTQQHVTAMLLIGSPFFDTRRDKIITFGAQQKLPTMYHFREYVVDGGLMSYGPSLGEAYREVGIYAARILNGATPADLPVVESTKLELVINLKTAKMLGLTIPASFLSLADDLID